MKKISESEIKLLFEINSCLLIGEYHGYDIPMDYKCKCGYTGKISLEKFKRRIKRQEGCLHCNKHEWTSEEDEIIKNYYGIESRKFILEKLSGVSYAMLKNRAFALKCRGNRSFSQKKARANYKRKYDYDLNYFDIVKTDRSYWSGFLSSNSVIKQNTLTIKFPIKDKDHFEVFQDAVLHTGVISVGKKHANAVFYGANSWINHLNNFPLDESNALAYIIGHIDAKGKIGDSLIEINGKENVLIWIKEWFDKLCPAITKRHSEIIFNKDTHHYVVIGQRAKYLIKKMKTIELPKLTRNWN